MEIVRMEIVRQVVSILVAIAGFANALLFVPQSWRIWKRENASGVSMTTFVGFLLFQTIYCMHGLLQRDWALALGMGASFCTCGTVVALAVRYRRSSTIITTTPFPEEHMHQDEGPRGAHRITELHFTAAVAVGIATGLYFAFNTNASVMSCVGIGLLSASIMLGCSFLLIWRDSVSDRLDAIEARVAALEQPKSTD